MNETEPEKPLTLKEMLQSVLAGALGVQSGKNRHRDFHRGKAHHFIVLGVSFTVVFTVILILIVKLVVYLAKV